MIQEQKYCGWLHPIGNTSTGNNDIYSCRLQDHIISSIWHTSLGPVWELISNIPDAGKLWECRGHQSEEYTKGVETTVNP